MLRAATQGADWASLAGFFTAAALGALDLAASPLSPSAELLGVVGESAPPPLDEAASGLLDALATEVRELVTAPPAGVSLAVTRLPPAAGPGRSLATASPAAPAWRSPFGARTAADPPSNFVALASKAPDDLLPVAIREVRGGELLEAALGDVYPLVLSSTAVRARLWARRLLVEASGR